MTTANRDALDLDAFSHRVALACADLADPIRQRLIADLNVHLRELDDHGDLQDLLGTPEDYARDLREAMDLPGTANAASPPDSPPPLVGRPTWWRRRPSTRRQLAWLVTAAGVVVLLVVVSLIAVAHSNRETPVAPATPAPTFTLAPAPAHIALPDVVGSSAAAAIALLHTAGITDVSVQFEHSPLPAGFVTSESPAPYTVVAPGSSVTLQVSTGP
jgi:hypothetical protein